VRPQKAGPTNQNQIRNLAERFEWLLSHVVSLIRARILLAMRRDEATAKQKVPLNQMEAHAE
jgi:hypothetical protein